MFDVYVSERIILLSSDRLVRMVVDRAPAVARRARRARARLDAWIVREGAGGGQRLQGGVQGGLQGGSAPAPAPVPAPVQASGLLPVVLLRSSASWSPPAPALGGRLRGRISSSSAFESSRSLGRKSRSSPRVAVEEFDSRLGSSGSPRRSPRRSPRSSLRRSSLGRVPGGS